jgi:ABC-type transport system involved in multi-copper enzyme maturation permease subunit
MATRKLRRRWGLDWPLLGKELLEQSAQKRMYVLRVTYALVLFGAFCFYYVRNLAGGSVLALGRGLGPFSFLVTTQLITIFLFLPPIMAGTIAQEKERDTLGLLFLTDLTPWELILQKYLGRLIPMLTLLFLSLPLLAVAYSLGGVSISVLCFSAVTLFLTCLVVGALALECSAHEATTFQALVRCWGLCLVFVFCCSIGLPRFVMGTMFTFGQPGIISAFMFRFEFMATVYLIATSLFLARAVENLEARAFVPRRNPFGHQFKLLDQYWKDLRKLMRAILRRRDQEAFAVAGKIVRRQLNALGDERQWSLGGFLLAKMQIPTLLAFAIIFGFTIIIVLFLTALMDPKSAPFVIIVGGFWILALLTLPILSANAVASERTNERLSAILTTPLTGPEILNEWMAPVRRWIQFLMRPLIVVFVVEAAFKFKIQDPADPRWRNLAVYFGISLLTVWIYPRLVQWFCLWIGLQIRNQIRAMMTAFLLVAAWCLIPLPVSGYLLETRLLSEQWSNLLNFVSPVTVIRTAEALGSPKSDVDLTLNLVVLVLAHFAVAAALMWKVRQLCLTNADRYLGRI